MLYQVLDRFSEYTMLAVAFFSMLVCIFSWKREQDYAALSYLIPVTYFVVFYTGVVFFAHTELVQNLLGRVGVFLYLVNTIVWRFVFLRRQQRRRYGEY